MKIEFYDFLSALIQWIYFSAEKWRQFSLDQYSIIYTWKLNQPRSSNRTFWPFSKSAFWAANLFGLKLLVICFFFDIIFELNCFKNCLFAIHWNFRHSTKLFCSLIWLKTNLKSSKFFPQIIAITQWTLFAAPPDVQLQNKPNNKNQSKVLSCRLFLIGLFSNIPSFITPQWAVFSWQLLIGPSIAFSWT